MLCLKYFIILSTLILCLEVQQSSAVLGVDVLGLKLNLPNHSHPKKNPNGTAAETPEAGDKSSKRPKKRIVKTTTIRPESEEVLSTSTTTEKAQEISKLVAQKQQGRGIAIKKTTTTVKPVRAGSKIANKTTPKPPIPIVLTTTTEIPPSATERPTPPPPPPQTTPVTEAEITTVDPFTQEEQNIINKIPEAKEEMTTEPPTTTTTTTTTTTPKAPKVPAKLPPNVSPKITPSKDTGSIGSNGPPKVNAPPPVNLNMPNDPRGPVFRKSEFGNLHLKGRNNELQTGGAKDITFGGGGKNPPVDNKPPKVAQSGAISTNGGDPRLPRPPSANKGPGKGMQKFPRFSSDEDDAAETQKNTAQANPTGSRGLSKPQQKLPFIPPVPPIPMPGGDID